MSNGNRIKETTTATNTATIPLAGAVASFRPFSYLVAGVKRTGLKVRVGPDSNGAWIIGAYDLTADSTLTRRAILDSSANGADVTLAAGSKEVELTFTAAQGDRIDSNTSARVVYTSSLCVSDADISLGSTNLGSDQGAKIQSLLDLNADGSPLYIVFDGAYGVSPQFSDAAVKVRSNTTITALPGCGLILRGTTDNIALLCNYDRTDGRGTGSSYPNNGAGNKNITINGGSWNGNGYSFRIFQFFGVDQLVLRDNKFFNSKHFHFHCGNVTNVTIDNPYVDKGSGGGIFGDGLHVCGPASNIAIRNATILNCGDDNIAFNADDAWVGNTETYQPRGPIINFSVRGAYIQSQLYGIRVLSGGSPVDNGLIEGIRGSTTGYCLVVDNFNPSQTAVSGPGNIGTLVLRDFDVDVVSGGGDPNLKAGAVIDCKIARLTIEGFRRSTFLNSEYASIQFGSKADIGQLIIDKYQGYPYDTGMALTAQLNFVSGSKVAYAKISNGMFHAPSIVNGYPITVQSGATIGQLVGIGNQGSNFTDFVQNNGTITKLHFPPESNFMEAASTSTWTLDPGFTEVSDSAVTYSGDPGRQAYSVQVARKAAVDSFNANIQLSTKVKFTGTPSQALNASLLVRGLNLQPYNGSNRSAYVLDFNQIAGKVTMQRSAGSVDTVIGSPITVSGGIAMNTQYKLMLTAKASAISARVQRVSDGFYLQTNGTWASTAVDCISGTDTAFGPGTGLQYGSYAYVFNNGGPVSGMEYTEFTAIAAP